MLTLSGVGWEDELDEDELEDEEDEDVGGADELDEEAEDEEEVDGEDEEVEIPLIEADGITSLGGYALVLTQSTLMGVES